MSKIKYAKSHEWVVVDDKGIGTVGISDFAQAALGDVVFVELPKTGSKVTAGSDVAVVESVKAASDIYSPVSGEVLEVNTSLQDAPETLNSSPLQQGWLYRIRLSNAAELDGLLDEAAYSKENS